MGVVMKTCVTPLFWWFGGNDELDVIKNNKSFCKLFQVLATMDNIKIDLIK